ncbi:MAG: Vitamin B12 dependent methionine synthase activation subunit [Dorea sp.]|nr:Vitamin B12 dependent methionine synthase activation subunit [Dorea sp.]
MDARMREAVRYLGYGGHAVDDQTLALIEDSFRELDRAADRRIIYRIFDVISGEADSLAIGKMNIVSRNLRKNLRDCHEALLLGATLGIGVDLLMKRYSLMDMTRAVVLQAAAAAILEEYLDSCQKKIGSELEAEGKYLRPRFSPGYGDFDIRYQDMMLRMLHADKSIGLTMTDSYMLTPAKSVTAVIGISGKKDNCPMQGCEACKKKDCIYRRNT